MAKKHHTVDIGSLVQFTDNIGSYSQYLIQDFEGLVQSCLPSFWKPSLSRMFVSGAIEVNTRHSKKMTRGERIQKAKELFQQGFSYRQIAMTLSVTKGTAYNYVNAYPYQ